jgi:hypothetical protein
MRTRYSFKKACPSGQAVTVESIWRDRGASRGNSLLQPSRRAESLRSGGTTRMIPHKWRQPLVGGKERYAVTAWLVFHSSVQYGAYFPVATSHCTVQFKLLI